MELAESFPLRLSDPWAAGPEAFSDDLEKGDTLQILAVRLVSLLGRIGSSSPEAKLTDPNVLIEEFGVEEYCDHHMWLDLNG